MRGSAQVVGEGPRALLELAASADNWLMAKRHDSEHIGVARLRKCIFEQEEL